MFDYHLEHIFTVMNGILKVERIGPVPEGMLNDCSFTGGGIEGPTISGRPRPVPRAHGRRGNHRCTRQYRHRRWSAGRCHVLRKVGPWRGRLSEVSSERPRGIPARGNSIAHGPALSHDPPQLSVAQPRAGLGNRSDRASTPCGHLRHVRRAVEERE
jgi:hypothetical protein